MNVQAMYLNTGDQVIEQMTGYQYGNPVHNLDSIWRVLLGGRFVGGPGFYHSLYKGSQWNSKKDTPNSP
jgi:hypothetical protein